MDAMQIGFEDVDFARTPFFGDYFSWVEKALEAWLHAKGLTDRELVGEREIGLPIVEADCRYTAPLGLEDVVEIHLALRDVTRRGFRINFEMARQADQMRVAHGHVLRRFIDLAQKRPIEIADELLRIFQEREQESQAENRAWGSLCLGAFFTVTPKLPRTRFRELAPEQGGAPTGAGSGR